MKVLEEAAESAKKMSCHNEADDKVTVLKVTTLSIYKAQQMQLYTWKYDYEKNVINTFYYLGSMG